MSEINIGLGFNFKSSVKKTMDGISKNIKTMNDEGKNFKLPEEMEKRIAALEKQYDELKNYVDGTMGAIGSFSEAQFKEFEKSINKQVAALKTGAEQTYNELVRLKTGFEASDGGKAFTGMMNGFDQLSSKAKETEEEIHKIFDLLNNAGIEAPRVNFFDDEDVAQAEKIIEQYNKVVKYNESINKANMGLFIRKDITASLDEQGKSLDKAKDALEQLSIAYRRALSYDADIEDLLDGQEFKDIEDSRQKEIIDTNLKYAEQLQIVRALAEYIQKTQKLSGSKEVKAWSYEGDSVADVLYDAEERYDSEYEKMLAQAKAFVEKYKGIINTDMLMVKDGQVSIPVELGLNNDALKAKFSKVIHDIQDFANVHPLFIKVETDDSDVKNKEIELDKKGEPVLSGLAKWRNDYANLLANMDEVASQIRQVYDPPLKFVDPTNLTQIVSSLQTLAGLDRPKVIDGVNELKFNDKQSTSIDKFGKAVKNLATGVAATQASEQAFSSFGATIKDANLSEVFKDVNLQGFAENLNGVSAGLKGIKIDEETQSGITGLTTLVTKLNEVKGIIPSDITPFTTLKSIVDTINEISVKSGISANSSEIETLAKAVQTAGTTLSPNSGETMASALNGLKKVDVNGKEVEAKLTGINLKSLNRLQDVASRIANVEAVAPDSADKFIKVIEWINRLNFKSVDIEDINKKVPSINSAMEQIVGIATRIGTVESSFTSDIKYMGQLGAALNSLSSINISGEQLSGKVKYLPGAMQNISNSVKYVGTINDSIKSSYKQFGNFINALNSLNDIKINSSDLITKTTDITTALTGFLPAVSAFAEINEKLPKDIKDFDAFILVLNDFNDIDINGSKLANMMADSPSAFINISSVATSIAEINKALGKTSIKDFKPFVNAINEFQRIDIDSNKLASRTIGIDTALKPMIPVAETIGKMNANVPQTFGQFKQFVDTINLFGGIKTSGGDLLGKVRGLSDAVKELNTALKTLLEMNKSLNGVTFNFGDFIAALNSLKEITGDFSGLYDKLGDTSKTFERLSSVALKLKELNDTIGKSLGNIEPFVQALNVFKKLDINGQELKSKVDGLSGAAGTLKDTAKKLSDAFAQFTSKTQSSNFVTSINALNTIKVEPEKLDLFYDLPNYVQKISVATALIPQSAELQRFGEMVTALNTLKEISLKKGPFSGSIEDTFADIYAIANSIKRSVEILPQHGYAWFTEFATGINNLNTIDITEKTYTNIAEASLVTKGVAAAVSGLPTNYAGFNSFAIAVTRLNSIKFDKDFTTKFNVLDGFALKVQRIIRNLPTNVQKFYTLADGLKYINEVKYDATNITNFGRFADALAKFEPLAMNYNTKGLEDLSNFVFLISDSGITAKTIDQLDRIPGIFARIRYQLDNWTDGATKFVTFLNSIFAKKKELSDLATVLRSGATEAKKAKDLMSPDRGDSKYAYTSLLENYKKLMSYQKQLNNTDDKKLIETINKQIAALKEENKIWVELIESQKLYDAEYDKQLKLAESSYNVAEKNVIAASADSNYKKLIGNYKHMTELQKQLAEATTAGNSDVVNSINAEITSLQKEIKTLEGVIGTTRAYDKELEHQLELEKNKYSLRLTKNEQSDEAKQAKLDAEEIKILDNAYKELIKTIDKYYAVAMKLTGKDKNQASDETDRVALYDELVSQEQTFQALKNVGLFTEEQATNILQKRIDKENDLYKEATKNLDSLEQQYTAYASLNGQSEEFYKTVKHIGTIIGNIKGASPGRGGVLNPDTLDMISKGMESVANSLKELDGNRILNEGSLFNADDLKGYASGLSDIDKRTVKVKKNNDQLVLSYTKLNGDVVTATYRIGQQGQALEKLGEETERVAGLAGAMKAFGEIFKSFGYYLSAAMLVRKFFNELRNGFEIVKEIDKQFTEMRKVSDETVQSLKEYVKESYEVAKVNGTTATTILSSTADYMRLGKSLNEAAELARNTAILMNVSEFENINDATDALISMTQAYQEVNTGLDSLDIIDKLNNIGNNFSISTSDLAQGLQRAAGTLAVAGNDINEAIALMVGGNAIMQDPLKVASGLRTISLRITGTQAAKKELEELGEDVDDFVITTSSKLNEKVKGLTKTMTNQAGVALLDMQGNYRSTYEILSDIANIWDEIKAEDALTGENRQNALLELLAGKNRSNVLASIFESTVYDKEADKMVRLIDAVYKKAQDSAGSAMKEQEKYLESLEGRLNILTTSAQEFWTTFINTDLAKDAVSLITQIVQGLTQISEAAGAVPTTLGLIISLLSFKGIRIVEVTKDIKAFITAIFHGKEAVEVLGKTGTDFQQKLVGFGNSFKAFAGNIAIFIAAVAAVKIISSAFDKLYNSVSECTQQIEETERALENVNREYNVLLEKGKLDSLTSAEKIRTEELKTQTEYLERQLKLRKQERAEALFNTNLGSSLDKDSFMSRFQEETKTIKSISEVISGYQNNTGIFEIFGGRYRFFGTEEKALEHYQNLLKQSRTDIELEQIQIVESIQEIQSYMSEGILDESTLPKAKKRLAEYKQALEESFYIIKEDQTRHGVYDISSYLKDHADIIRTLSRDSRSGKPSLDAFRESFGYLYDEASIAGLKWEQILSLIGDKQTADNANKPIAKLSDTFNALNSQISKTSEEMGTVSDAFDKATSSIKALREAQEKLKNGELTQEDVLSLIKDNPKLAASIDWNDVNFGGLSDAITAEIERVRQQEIQELEARQSVLEDLMAPPEITDDIKLFYEQYNSAIDGLSNFGISDKTNVFQGFENQVDEALRGYGAEVREINGEKVAYIPYSLYWDAQNPTKVSDADVEDYLNEIMNGEDNGEHRIGLFPILKMGEDAEEVAKKYNAAVNYQQSYDDLLKACGNDSEALSVATNILGSDMSAVSEEYAVNAARLEYLKNLIGTHTKTVSDLHEEYDTAMGKISNLDSAIEKLLSKQMKDSDVIDLMLEFKELAGFEDIDLNDKVDFGNLLQRLMQLRNNLPTPLIKEMQELRDKIAETASQETLNELDTLIAGLQRAVTFDVTGSDAFTQAISDAFGRTNSTVQSTLSYYEDLAKLQEAIADGFVMDAEKAWELAQMFPELSKGIMEYGVAGDGLVELNEEIVKGLLEGGDTAIDATIKQLEAEKELLVAKKKAAETELQIAIDALNSKDLAQKEAAIVEVERYLEVGKQKLEIEQEVDEGVAQSDQDQIDNHGLVAKMVGKVSKFFSENMGQAAQDASQSVSDSSEKMQWSLANIVDAAQGAWAAVKSIGQNVFGGFKSVVGGAGGSTIFSRVKGWFGNFTSGVAAGVESLQTTVTNFVDAAWGTSFGIHSRLQELIADLHIELGNYDDAIASLDGQITTLKNLQGNVAERIKRSGDDDGSGGSGGSDGSDGESAADQFSETFDWIERAIEMVEKAVERLSKTAGNVYSIFSKRNRALLDQVEKVKEEIYLQQEAYVTYRAIAESIDLAEEYKAKVQKGLLQVEIIENEELSEKINLYKEWYFPCPYAQKCA